MWSIVLFEALILLRGSLHISCASLRNGVSLQNDPTTHNVEKWRIPVFISEMFTTTGWLSHSVLKVVRQTSTGVIIAQFQKCVLQWPLANHQHLFYMKKFESFGNSISQDFLTGNFQILHVDTLALEVVAGSPSPWVRPGHIDPLADRRSGKGSIATYSGHTWQHHLNHMIEVNFTSIATWLL